MFKFFNSIFTKAARYINYTKSYYYDGNKIRLVDFIDNKNDKTIFTVKILYDGVFIDVDLVKENHNLIWITETVDIKYNNIRIIANKKSSFDKIIEELTRKN